MGANPSKELKHVTSNKLNELIQSNCVVIFSLTTCPSCTVTKKAFDILGEPYTVIELNQRADGYELHNALYHTTGIKTVPRVFINGKCIGGGLETRRLLQEGRLLSLIAECKFNGIG